MSDVDKSDIEKFWNENQICVELKKAGTVRLNFHEILLQDQNLPWGPGHSCFTTVKSKNEVPVNFSLNPPRITHFRNSSN